MRQTNRLKYLLVLPALFIVLLLAFPDAAYAQGNFYGSRIPADMTVDNDVLLAGPDVVIDGTVNGDVVALGSRVTINGAVNGSLITVGENIAINGRVRDSVYALSVVFTLGATGSVERSVYLVGVRLVTEPNSTIGRDLTVVSLDGNLKGSIARDIRATIGILELARWLMDVLNVQRASMPAPAQPTAVTEPLQLVSLSTGAVGSARTAAAPPAQAQVSADSVRDWVAPRLRDLVAVLIVGGLGLWLLPRQVRAAVEWMRKRPLQSAGYGFVAYIVYIVGAVMLAVMIALAGIGLFALSLPSLGWLVWGIAYSALALAVWLFVLLAGYGSYALVGYVLGLWVLERIYPRATANRIFPLLLGGALAVLVGAIPYLGAVWGFVLAFLTLGAVWQAVREARAPQPAEVAGGE